jgi:hypothetical protein
MRLLTDYKGIIRVKAIITIATPHSQRQKIGRSVIPPGELDGTPLVEGFSGSFHPYLRADGRLGRRQLVHIHQEATRVRGETHGERFG